MRAVFLTIVAIIILGVVGGIVWVHFYYLPHNAAMPRSSAIGSTSSPSPTSVPSPKTAAAMQAIQYLVQQNYLPLLDATPTPLTLTLAPTTGSTTLSYLGLTFSAPWEGIAKTTQKGDPPTFVEVDFVNGRSITIMRGLTSSPSTLTQWNAASSSIRTDYDLDMAAFNAIPSEVMSSTPGNQAVLIASLLTLKTSLWSPGPVYSFKTETADGFQHGVASTTKPVGIDLYNSEGKPYILIVKGMQDDINYILASAK